MATLLFTFDTHPAKSIRVTIDRAYEEKVDRMLRIAAAVRSQERHNNNSGDQKRVLPSEDVHRILLGQTAVGAIQRLIMAKRIALAERAVKAGKDRLADEVRRRKRDGTGAVIQQSRMQNFIKMLPRPGGRFGVPQVNLNPEERHEKVRQILNETQAVVKKYHGSILPDEERQKIIRRYLGILGGECDAAITNMGSPLPVAEQLSVPLLLEYGIGIRDLIFGCQIPISELYDAQIITSLNDLEALGFSPSYLGKERSAFSVDDFVSLFGGSYADLKDRFKLTLSMLPQSAFSVRQLRLLSFSFASETGTLDDIQRMKLTVEELADFGLTTSILTNQFQMSDVRDLSRKLRWGKADIHRFTVRTEHQTR